MKRVCAIVCAYNEEDIIEESLLSLIKSGIDVYFIDNGSTDTTASIAGALVGKGVVDVQSIVHRNPDGSLKYDWSALLSLKETLSKRLGYDWYIHADADEIRLSPWRDVNLSEAIDRVDFEGYSLLNFKVFNFRPTEERRVTQGFESSFRYYEKGYSGDATQVKAWRACEFIDLHSSGGHRARIREGSVYPVRFILKHYPLRSLDQIRRKLTVDRVQRFAGEELDKGWHRQYQSIPESVLEFGLWDHTLLVEYDHRKEIASLFSESVAYMAMKRNEGVISPQDIIGHLGKVLAARGYNPTQVDDFLVGVLNLASRVYNDLSVSVDMDESTRRVLRYCLRFVAAQYFSFGDARLADNLVNIYVNGERLFSGD